MDSSACKKFMFPYCQVDNLKTHSALHSLKTHIFNLKENQSPPKVNTVKAYKIVLKRKRFILLIKVITNETWISLSSKYFGRKNKLLLN
jgi:hypothetical protein